MPADPSQSSVPLQSSACDLKAQLFLHLVLWIIVIAQCGGFAELLPLTIITVCELKQEQLYLSKEKTGMFLGFGGFFIESILHVHSSLCSEIAFRTQVVAPLSWE